MSDLLKEALTPEMAMLHVMHHQECRWHGPLVAGRMKTPAGQPKTTPMQRYPGGRPAGRPKPKLSLAGRPAGINTDWPAGRARNSRPSSPRSPSRILKNTKKETKVWKFKFSKFQNLLNFIFSKYFFKILIFQS